MVNTEIMKWNNEIIKSCVECQNMLQLSNHNYKHMCIKNSTANNIASFSYSSS